MSSLAAWVRPRVAAEPLVGGVDETVELIPAADVHGVGQHGPAGGGGDLIGGGDAGIVVAARDDHVGACGGLERLGDHFAGRARVDVDFLAVEDDVVEEGDLARVFGDVGAFGIDDLRLVADGVRKAMEAGSRCKQLEVILDEIDAVRHAMSRANRGDLVVVCVDKHPAVMEELESWSEYAQAGASIGGTEEAPGADPDYTPPTSPTNQ